jgi:hypothetical protein
MHVHTAFPVRAFPIVPAPLILLPIYSYRACSRAETLRLNVQSLRPLLIAVVHVVSVHVHRTIGHATALDSTKAADVEEARI